MARFNTSWIPNFSVTKFSTFTSLDFRPFLANGRKKLEKICCHRWEKKIDMWPIDPVNWINRFWCVTGNGDKKVHSLFFFGCVRRRVSRVSQWICCVFLSNFPYVCLWWELSCDSPANKPKSHVSMFTDAWAVAVQLSRAPENTEKHAERVLFRLTKSVNISVSKLERQLEWVCESSG